MPHTQFLMERWTMLNYNKNSMDKFIRNYIRCELCEVYNSPGSGTIKIGTIDRFFRFDAGPFMHLHVNRRDGLMGQFVKRERDIGIMAVKGWVRTLFGTNYFSYGSVIWRRIFRRGHTIRNFVRRNLYRFFLCTFGIIICFASQEGVFDWRNGNCLNMLTEWANIVYLRRFVKDFWYGKLDSHRFSLRGIFSTFLSLWGSK